MSLKSKILKKSTIEETASLEASKIWEKKDIISTHVPALNVALSGDLFGGMGPGILQIAGKSKMFKSKFALLIADAFQKKFPDGVVLIYDSEFGTPKSYYNGMITDNIIHSSVVEIEELTHDIIAQFDEVDPKENDKLLVIIDSLGNLASKKEVADAREGSDAADLTRPKKVKSLFRIIGPRVGVKDIYVIVINHTYDTIEKYSKQVVGGGCLVEGTEILLENGSFIKIEEIKKGDYIKTLEGNKEVTDVWNPSNLINGEPDCFEVEFEDGNKIICSENHKFLKNNEWIEIKNLVKGDDLINIFD